ncbi:hypothetical protein QOZ80_2BG0200070 [Eleusine coracana subsp. coracana]|nr:hypothetical protein QOZ80_2BG0200070 [Eleusine coracana subsp. coracana]
MNSTSSRPHAVLVTYPAQGHVTPLLQLAKVLHSRGFFITYVNSDYNHCRLLRSRGAGLDDFRFKTIPGGLPPSDNDDMTQDMMSSSLSRNGRAAFRDLLVRLNGAPGPAPVRSQVRANRRRDGIRPRCGQRDGCPGAPVLDHERVRLHGVPPIRRARQKVLRATQRRELHDQRIPRHGAGLGSRRVYTVGSLSTFAETGLDPARASRDQRQPVKGERELPAVAGRSGRPRLGRAGEKAVLPEEFFAEVKDRGHFVSWCPQRQVLSCPIRRGLFLMHCGWNSTLKAFAPGVPMVCWPFFAQQMTNCRYACTNWGVGLEIDSDVRREDVTCLVREAMDGETGKYMREKAMVWKEKAMAATEEGGTSSVNIHRLLERN